MSSVTVNTTSPFMLGACVWARESIYSPWIRGIIREIEVTMKGNKRATRFHLELQTANGQATGSPMTVVTLPLSSLEFEDVKPCNPVDGVPDVTFLQYLHEPALLASLQARFRTDEIYTNAGPILIAMVCFSDYL